jgi:hypothetical protein
VLDKAVVSVIMSLVKLRRTHDKQQWTGQRKVGEANALKEEA